MSSHQMAADIQKELRGLPGNNRCVDCQAPYPQWATVSYGTFMCLECSGRHRGLGVHISFVRSVTMDSWTDVQIKKMQLGGNDKFREEFKKAGVPDNLTIAQKYNTPQAEAYRQKLQDIAEGKQVNSCLPRYDSSILKQNISSSNGSSNTIGDAKGMEPLSGESEEDYVKRQMRLKEDARARMQAKFGSGGLQGIGSNGSASSSNNSFGDFSSSLNSAFSKLSTTVSSVASSAATAVSEQKIGEKVQKKWSSMQQSGVTSSVKSSASSGWAAISSGAESLWKTASSMVDPKSQDPDHDFFPRTNEDIAGRNTYGNGIGSESVQTEEAAFAQNDSWLEEELKRAREDREKNSFQSFSRKKSSVNESEIPSTGRLAKEKVETTSSTIDPNNPRNLSPEQDASKAKKREEVDFFAKFGV